MRSEVAQSCPTLCYPKEYIQKAMQTSPLILKHFNPCKMTLTISITPHSLLAPALGNHWSTFCLWVCLTQVSHLISVIWFVSLCAWLLSLSMVLPRLTVLGHVSWLHRSCLRLSDILVHARTTFVYLFISGWTLELYPVWLLRIILLWTFLYKF